MIQFIDIKDCMAAGARDMQAAHIRTENGQEYDVDFSRQKTGYGEKVVSLPGKPDEERSR